MRRGDETCKMFKINERYTNRRQILTNLDLAYHGFICIIEHMVPVQDVCDSNSGFPAASSKEIPSLSLTFPYGFPLTLQPIIYIQSRFPSQVNFLFTAQSQRNRAWRWAFGPL